jgi:membrane-associated phospholipid phosphatase
MRSILVRLVMLTAVVILSNSASAQTTTDSGAIKVISPEERDSAYSFPRPKPFSFITDIPADLKEIAKSPFKKKNLLNTSLVIGSSALMIAYDQQIYDEVRRFSDRIHLDPQTEYKTVFNVKVKNTTTKILKIPKNVNSAFYTLGEGWIGVAVAGGFFLQGKIGHNNRSLQTSSDLVEAFIGSGISSQIIKRISGRETPFMATAKGGRWRPFPSFSEFQNNTPAYDAFPSGHLETMMATVTVLAEDYPEKKWIKPVGYVLVGLTGFAMVNTGVHWAGDYPLALALGYLHGRIITARHKRSISHNNITSML